MTAEEYQERDRACQLRILRDLKTSVRSIDGKVEEILDELKEHLQDLGGSGNAWNGRDFYNHEHHDMD